MVSAVSAAGTVGLRYDPLGRLYEVTDTSGSQRRLYYDGADLVLEFAGTTGALLRRFVHGPSAGDDALLWYEGSTVSNATRRHLHADRLGSIVAVTDYQGNLLAANAYDEFGVPDQHNIGRFQYTGQAWVPELGMFYYKARMYSPTLGRFMQTDPIGYGDGMNMYAYVGNDPVNGVDYWGLKVGDSCTTKGGNSGTEQEDGGCPEGSGPILVTTNLFCDVICRLGDVFDIPAILYFGPGPDNDAAPDEPRPDYCGSEGSEGVPDGNWGEACRRHDQCYALDGANKEACDRQLTRDITRECISNGGAGAANVCAAVGLAYGGVLVALGFDTRNLSVPIPLLGPCGPGGCPLRGFLQVPLPINFVGPSREAFERAQGD